MNTSTHTILIVEDDPNDVQLLRLAFRRAGLACPVRVVSDGDAAVAYLAGQGAYADRRRHPLPTLILLDLKLPRRSGLEVLEWLRRQPRLRRVPTVVLTSSERSGDVNRAYDLGANSYLVKPVALEALRQIVAALDSYWLRHNERPHVAPEA